jgi:hypothetical protein
MHIQLYFNKNCSLKMKKFFFIFLKTRWHLARYAAVNLNEDAVSHSEKLGNKTLVHLYIGILGAMLAQITNQMPLSFILIGPFWWAHQGTWQNSSSKKGSLCQGSKFIWLPGCLTNKQTDRQTDKQTNRQTNKKQARQTDWQTYKQTKTDRQTDRQTDR